MSHAILVALRALDVSNDNHWTADGLPRLETVKMLASDPNITRDAVVAAAPGFTRANAATYQPPQPAAPGVQPVLAGSPSNGTEEAVVGSEPVANAATSVTQTEPPQVDGDAGSATDEIEALETALAQATEEVDRLRTVRDEAVAAFNAAQLARDQALLALENASGTESDADGIQAYLAAQVARNEERIAARKAVAESGVNLKDLSERLAAAPIDRAMARNRGRGTRRPVIG